MPPLPPAGPDPAAPPPAVRPTARRSRTLAAVALAALGVVALGALWLLRPGLSEEEVRSAVLTSIARESPEGFVVTGRLSSGLTTRSARRWRVRVLNLEAGRATVTVALPGEVTYGFPLDALTPDDITYRSDGVVVIQMPRLEVFSVEPVLEEATVDAEVTGAARLTPSLTEASLQQALRRVRPALREQAEQHLATSDQPARNAARALRQMLQTPLDAAGVRDARFAFVLGRGDTLMLGPDGRTQALAP